MPSVSSVSASLSLEAGLSKALAFPLDVAAFVKGLAALVVAKPDPNGLAVERLEVAVVVVDVLEAKGDAEDELPKDAKGLL